MCHFVTLERTVPPSSMHFLLFLQLGSSLHLLLPSPPLGELTVLTFPPILPGSAFGKRASGVVREPPPQGNRGSSPALATVSALNT